MKNKISLIFALVFGIISFSRSQSIEIQVINSAGGGGSVGATGYESFYNIGETVITTITSATNTVTQGFLQPDVLGKYGLVASAINSGVSCIGKTDGAITVSATVTGVLPQVLSDIIIHYYWEPSSICPTNTCSSVTGLVPGTYSVLVVSEPTGTLTLLGDTVKIENIVITDSFEPCLITVYNGVTPNGDGVNDYLHIDNIDQYPDNVVDIYNRWGLQLAHITKYDNKDHMWKGTINNTDNVVPSGTYFYVIDLGDKKSKLIKGWIELLHN